MSDQPNLNDILSQMHLDLAKRLLERINKGEATAADFNVARQLLKDNNIQSLASGNPALPGLRLALPEFDDDRAEAV